MTTGWDDLELPAVDEAWRLKLAKRMPAPGARGRKLMLAGATFVAIAAATIALFFGLRKPEVVVKEVRVEIDQTKEAAPVAAALVEADKAARRAAVRRSARLVGAALHSDRRARGVEDRSLAAVGGRGGAAARVRVGAGGDRQRAAQGGAARPRAW